MVPCCWAMFLQCLGHGRHRCSSFCVHQCDLPCMHTPRVHAAANSFCDAGYFFMVGIGWRRALHWVCACARAEKCPTVRVSRIVKDGLRIQDGLRVPGKAAALAPTGYTVEMTLEQALGP